MGYRLYISEESEQAIKGIVNTNGVISNAAVCCASMLVERMLDLSFPPELCAHFAVQCGALSDETGFVLLAGAIAGRFSLKNMICGEELALDEIRNGAKGIVRYPHAQDAQMRYYLIDHISGNTVFIINPSIQQGKGMARSKKRLIQTKDEYWAIPYESYRIFYPEDAQYFVFSI